MGYTGQLPAKYNPQKFGLLHHWNRTLNGDLCSGIYSYRQLKRCHLPIADVYSKLQPTFNNTQSTYNEQSTPGFKHWVILLIFKEYRVT